MRSLKLILLLLLVNCQKPEKNVIIGSWKNCSKSGNYSEIKFTDKYMLLLKTNSNEILLFKNKFSTNQIILTEYKNGIGLPNKTDTITILSATKNRISLKSEFSKSVASWKKINSEINEIDSLNLETWRNNTLEKFNKKAKLENCLDLRTEKEKIIHDFGTIELPKEEEINIFK